jgi:hypothetical protein
MGELEVNFCWDVVIISVLRIQNSSRKHSQCLRALVCCILERGFVMSP